MTSIGSFQLISERFYLLDYRPLTHLSFWLVYYVLYSLIWMKPDTGYFGSFYLEFMLLPARMLAVYGTLYVLIPRYLLNKRFFTFIAVYVLLLALASGVQALADYFFYQRLFLQQEGSFWSLTSFVRAGMLVNTTVIFVSALKLLQLYFDLRQQLTAQPQNQNKKIEIKANRKTHLVGAEQILFVEGMGNYVSYVLKNQQKLIAHGSIKAALQKLPDNFIRCHRSFIVNRNAIEAFSTEDIHVAEHTISRGKDVSDEQLKPTVEC